MKTGICLQVHVYINVVLHFAVRTVCVCAAPTERGNLSSFANGLLLIMGVVE